MTLPPEVERAARARSPFLWINDHWRPVSGVPSQHGLADVRDAYATWNAFAPLLVQLFPELAASKGVIDSPLTPVNRFKEHMMGGQPQAGRWFIKGDHALPIAGSVKARGGVYEVLLHARDLALQSGILKEGEGLDRLASSEARQLFAKHRVSVGSTGNLGLSIGVMATALGFKSTVHMSSDAKEWKKKRLRARGVEVAEHRGNFGEAVAAGRGQAQGDSTSYFVDDENSSRLFFGYSAAAIHLQTQLEALGIEVDAQHPLFVYLPCGVGGAPGGITFGLRHLFGDHVHCFLAEPVTMPCVLLRLAQDRDSAISVEEVGLGQRTEADGLAVTEASAFVAPMIRHLVAGAYTVQDEELFEDLYHLERTERIEIEPSAAAGFRGPHWVLESDKGRAFLRERGAIGQLAGATHVLWTTGGSFVPPDEYRAFYERGRALVDRRCA